ncbi:hypothetical protein [Rhizobium sp. LC145]|uniref:hypothetical protein n=1 Tax=Rhizobium sp. LC145 TaxID=1120688 RepID=UPI0009E651F2|nr:hypothetical protein [Rhizobium sp. LC145]TKT58000.1 hypothetical protein FDR95_12565 [Rhizobiaceae bacterium LC148]
MRQTVAERSSAPFESRDLQICQRVFDSIRTKINIAKDCEEAERIAAITVELYRQGVRDPDHLETLVAAARGLFEKSH